jgi:hypothetical protein
MSIYVNVPDADVNSLLVFPYAYTKGKSPASIRLTWYKSTIRDGVISVVM